jgi:hypothetical protein
MVERAAFLTLGVLTSGVTYQAVLVYIQTFLLARNQTTRTSPFQRQRPPSCINNGFPPNCRCPSTLEGFTRVPSSPLRVVRRKKSLSLTSNNNRDLDRTTKPFVHMKDLPMICSLLKFELRTTENQK